MGKYEVYVRPASSSKRTARDVGSSAMAGAIGGLAGADVAGDAFIIKCQEKQYSAVASNAKILMKLIGLEAKIKS